MRRTLMRGAGITAVLAVMMACSEKTATPGSAMRKRDVVNITANCTAPNQIDVKSDNWEAEVKKKAEVTFNVISTSTPAPVVEIDKTTDAEWAFSEAPPFKFGDTNGGNSRKGKAKDKAADYRYVIRVSCGEGATATRVVIDPDIFVN